MSRVPQYVLFPLGKKRFALAADSVAELARPDRLQTFPHTTPLMVGVLARRGHIIPVCDVAEVLVGSEAPPRKFYLIATCQAGRSRELIALPVTGECELTAAQMRPPTGKLPEYVCGLLSVGEELVQVLSLEMLVSIGAGKHDGTDAAKGMEART